jgi:hypothetical protein
MKNLLHATLLLVNDNAGGDVTLSLLSRIAGAIQSQISDHYSAFWGNEGVTIATGPLPSGPLEGVIPVYIRAASDVAGAAGYHDDDGIYVFRDGLPELTSGAFSLSVVVSHEILETLTDPGANRWADRGDGVEVAVEACDAVEGFCYEMDGISVSDFLLPSFFDPAGQAPYSYLLRPTAPFQTAPDGGQNYQITRQVNENGVKQVFASAVRGARIHAKQHPKSRTSRRGARAFTRDGATS